MKFSSANSSSINKKGSLRTNNNYPKNEVNVCQSSSNNTIIESSNLDNKLIRNTNCNNNSESLMNEVPHQCHANFIDGSIDTTSTCSRQQKILKTDRATFELFKDFLKWLEYKNSKSKNDNQQSSSVIEHKKALTQNKGTKESIIAAKTNKKDTEYIQIQNNVDNNQCYCIELKPAPKTKPCNNQIVPRNKNSVRKATEVDLNKTSAQKLQARSLDFTNDSGNSPDDATQDNVKLETVLKLRIYENEDGTLITDAVTGDVQIGGENIRPQESYVSVGVTSELEGKSSMSEIYAPLDKPKFSDNMETRLRERNFQDARSWYRQRVKEASGSDSNNDNNNNNASSTENEITIVQDSASIISSFNDNTSFFIAKIQNTNVTFSTCGSNTYLQENFSNDNHHNVE